MILAVVAALVVIFIIFAGLRIISSAIGALVSLLITLAIGIALIAAAIAFPPLGIAVVGFFLIKGMLSKSTASARQIED